jgi:hypothetical protein
LVVVAFVEVVLPEMSDLNDKFSVQADPFQYKVELVAVPLARLPPPLATLAHFVLVPVDERYCPKRPDRPKESRSGPTSERLLEIVAFVIVALAMFVFEIAIFVIVAFVIVAWLAKRLTVLVVLALLVEALEVAELETVEFEFVE